MANTYTQLFVHLIFSTESRCWIIKESIRNEVEKYITKIIASRKSKTLAIYCNPDHIHILVGLNPNLTVADLVRDIKAGSSKWINEKRLVIGKFAWQRGYGGFSYSKSQVDTVCKYIINQPMHHKRFKFEEEYISFMDKFDVEYDKKYLFD